MINGMVLGMAMLVSSTGAGSSLQPSRAAAAPSIFTFDLPDGAVRPREGFHRPRASATQQPTTTKRHSKTERIIAVVAGVSLGFVLGGTIGGYVTGNRDNPDDDTSLLRGVVIGAPIGAVAGGLLGYHLTK